MPIDIIDNGFCFVGRTALLNTALFIKLLFTPVWSIEAGSLTLATLTGFSLTTFTGFTFSGFGSFILVTLTGRLGLTLPSTFELTSSILNKSSSAVSGTNVCSGSFFGVYSSTSSNSSANCSSDIGV